MSTMKRNMKLLNSSMHNWDEDGATVAGFYQGFEEKTFEGRPVHKHTVLTEDGERINFWGTLILCECLDPLQGNPFVEIEFKGMGGSANRQYKNFSVGVEEEDNDIPI